MSRTGDDAFWDKVEVIAEDYLTDFDVEHAAHKLAKLGCDKETVDQIIDSWTDV